MFTLGDKPIRNVLVQCDHGSLIVNRYDYRHDGVGVGGFILEHGNNNTVEANTACTVLQDIDKPIILDIGANIGTFATWVARWADPRQGKVYCFEPQRPVFQILCGNMALNNIHNVYAYEMALGSEEKFIDLPEVNYNTLGSFGAFSLADTDLSDTYTNIPNTKQRIKMTTVDNFVNDYQLEKVDYMKIDAEGLDIDVILGAINTIQKYKPDLYVEYLNLGPSKKEDTSDQGRTILSNLLTGLGYKFTVIGHDIYASVRDVFKEITE